MADAITQFLHFYFVPQMIKSLKIIAFINDDDEYCDNY